MKVYSDIFTDSEVFSDAYPTTEVYDVLYMVECDKIQICNGVDSKVYGGDCGDAGYGGEKGEAEYAEQVDDSIESGYNIVLHYGLKRFDLSKADYKAHIRTFLKRVLDKIDDPNRKEIFKKKSQEFLVKELLPKFDDFVFYTDAEYNTEAMISFATISDDGKKATFYIWKDAVIGEKC